MVFILAKNRTLKALPSFFDSAATNLLKQAWEVDLSLSQALCFVFCFLGNKKAAWWGGSFVSVVHRTTQFSNSFTKT